ncbi:hypothetical protein Tco_0186027 [Tanacetum coccineum]|uniref:Uncharacterized protein n=1 Tax=Tanacetum coccineum TaxID=301880 RepID=A0ABQ5GZ89_9ASTR
MVICEVSANHGVISLLKSNRSKSLSGTVSVIFLVLRTFALRGSQVRRDDRLARFSAPFFIRIQYRILGAKGSTALSCLSILFSKELL